MDFKPAGATLSKVEAGVAAAGVFESEPPSRQLKKLDRAFPARFLREIDEYARSEGFKGKAGQILSLPTFGALSARTLLICGLGRSADFDAQAVRRMCANVVRRVRQGGSVCLFLPAGRDGRSLVRAAVEGWLLGGYKFSKYKSVTEDEDDKRVLHVTLGGVDLAAAEFRRAVDLAVVVAEAVNFARDMIAEPASYMTPSRFAREARRVARENRLTVTVMDAADVEKLGMGSFLGVARGAKEPPRFVVVKYRPQRARKTVALVGKGVTFDSGGLSLKTAQGMEYMKYDMSGAAAVLATMQAVGRVRPAVAVTGVMVLTENMPGGAALHPGDVLTAMNGKTIEVNNTDAEGRLILADALCYTCRQKPDEVLDIATLTGAVTAALGKAAAGIMGNDAGLVDRIVDAGEAAGEKFWRLPLFDEYKDHLKSDIADLKNAGSRGEAGSSSAGMFLKEFVDGTPWAHLDIAGVGWRDKEKDELCKGGIGFGVRTFCRYLIG